MDPRSTVTPHGGVSSNSNKVSISSNFPTHRRRPVVVDAEIVFLIRKF